MKKWFILSIECAILHLGIFGTMMLNLKSCLPFECCQSNNITNRVSLKVIKPLIQSVLLNDVLMNWSLFSGCMLPSLHATLCIYACALMMGGLGTVGPNLVWIDYCVSNEIVFETLDPRGIDENEITNKWMQIQIWCINTEEISNWIFWAGHMIPGSFIDNTFLDTDSYCAARATEDCHRKIFLGGTGSFGWQHVY